MNPEPVNCPVCSLPSALWSNASDREYFSVAGEFSYFGCGSCGTIFIHPVPVELLARIYPPNYYSFVNKGGNIVTRLKEWLDKRFFRKILRAIPGEELHVLDVGGGTGWMLDILKKAEKRISHTQVVDIDEKAMDLAVERGHSYFKGTMEAFTTGKKYHLILMLNLVEHVHDPLGILKKAESLLAPGGRIVIKTPNAQSWDASLFRNSYWGGLHAPRHWVIFTKKSFIKLLTSTSLEIDTLQYTQGAPFWAFSIIAALHKKGWIKVSADRPVIFHWLFAPLSAVFAIFDFARRPFAPTSQMFLTLRK